MNEIEILKEYQEKILELEYISNILNWELYTKAPKKSLNRLNVDNYGLDQIDIEYLTSLITKFNGGPVGVETIATSIGEEVTTIEDVYEPYLLQKGFIIRTPRGRIATEKAYKHMNRTTNSMFI